MNTDLKKIVLASGNPGKLRELQACLQPLSLTLIPQDTLQITAVEETGLSFVENALLKARHAAQISKQPTIADDSGLAVSALNDAPGIYSARYGGIQASNQDNIDKLLSALQNVPIEKRGARFICVIAFLRH
ncbi:MAG: non-canonical purine NTP pyrophosphatase, partial [Gammaproteobacteria bacterium]